MTEQDRSMSMITLLVQNTLALAQSTYVNNAACRGPPKKHPHKLSSKSLQ